MTKKQEIEIFKIVNDKLWKFKEWDHSESPDFLVHQGSSIIGVELTEVIRKKIGENIAKKYAFEDKLAALISDKLSVEIDLPLHGHIDFKSEINLNQNTKEGFINQVVQKIKEHSKSLNKDQWSINHKIDSQIPQEINWISYDCAPFLNECRFYPARYKKTEFLFDEDILNTIKKKELKIEQYHHDCQKIILLIIEGILPASWIGELEKPMEKVETSFDGVVLFHYHGLKTITLK